MNGYVCLLKVHNKTNYKKSNFLKYLKERNILIKLDYPSVKWNPLRLATSLKAVLQVCIFFMLTLKHSSCLAKACTKVSACFCIIDGSNGVLQSCNAT